MSRPVAPQLAGLVERLLGVPLPVRIRAWDGSEAGVATGPVVVIRQRRALRRLLWNPGELGLARATPASLMARWADAADDSPRASMTAAPRLPTVGRNVVRFQFSSLIRSFSDWPSTVAKR